MMARVAVPVHFGDKMLVIFLEMRIEKIKFT
jgi:hypothetical protein